MKDNNHLANRFGEKHISIPSHDPTPLFHEDEYGMTREEEVEKLDWSHDPRSESFNEGHSQERFKNALSDEFISQHARIALSLSPELTSQYIEVKVIQGCVYLDGFVQSRRQKKTAEYCVENLSGVTDVFNRLNIPHH